MRHQEEEGVWALAQGPEDPAGLLEADEGDPGLTSPPGLLGRRRPVEASAQQ
jgi:hypothetical protein